MKVYYVYASQEPIYSEEPITVMCQCLQLKKELFKNEKKSVSIMLAPGSKSLRGCNSATTRFCLIHFLQFNKKYRTEEAK